MFIALLKAIIVGICASAPLGPVAMLVIRKTIRYDRRVGMISGLGSAAVDTLYAIVGVCTISAVDAFINNNYKAVSIIGGAIVIIVGICMIYQNPFRKEVGEIESPSLISQPLQAAGLAFANPGALALMLALLAMFNIEAPRIVVVAGLSLGAVLWWCIFAFVIDKVRSNLKVKTLVIINRILGLLVVLFGLIWIIKVF